MKPSSDTVVEPIETTEPPLAGFAVQSIPSETEYVLKKAAFLRTNSRSLRVCPSENVLIRTNLASPKVCP